MNRFRYLILFFKLHYLNTQFTLQQWTCPWTFTSGSFHVRRIVIPGSQSSRSAPAQMAAETSKVLKTGLQMFSWAVQLLQQLVRLALFSNSLMFYFHTWKRLLINQVQWVCFSLRKKRRKNWNRSCWVIWRLPDLKGMRNTAEMAMD